MKRILWMLLLTLALPMAAFADSSVDFSNSGGTLSGSSAGLTLSGSTLTSVNGLGGLITGNLGMVSFSTGALASGNMSSDLTSTFAGGGSFVIAGNGSNGLPNGDIFNGSFTGPETWTLSTDANGDHYYTLSGTIQGTWYNGSTVAGATVQITMTTGKGYFNGSVNLGSGDTEITVPEPGSLALLGTGLVGLAGAIRRKLSA